MLLNLATVTNILFWAIYLGHVFAKDKLKTVLLFAATGTMGLNLGFLISHFLTK